MQTLKTAFFFVLASWGASVSARVYNIRDFGAVADGKTVNTVAIQRANDNCRNSGGGVVLIPAGTFVSGPIQLFSNIELLIETGATLKGSGNVSDYFIAGKKLGLIYTENSTNVSITGGGNIDGNGDAFMELDRSKVFDTAATKYTRQGIHFREVLSGPGDGPLVPKDGPFQMIIFSNCKEVTVREVLISNSPFWTLHLADCDGAIITGVRIWNNLMIPNNDGLDLTSCSNVQVSDCDIRTGDDAIAITGYAYNFDLPGYKNITHSSENITVTNCYFVSRSSAIRVGGWDQNDMLNYTFSNIIISNSNRGIDLCVRDQGSIRNMIFSNIIIHTRLFTGDWGGNGEPIHISAIRGKENVKLGKIGNIRFNDVICNGESGVLMYGTDESGIEDVTFHNCSIHINDSELNSTCGGNFDLRPVIDHRSSIFAHDVPAFYACDVGNIKLYDVNISWGDVKELYFTNAVDITHFDSVPLDGCTLDRAPHSAKSAVI
ncbi:MAG TPA: glycosyl hydrolase family 28 protein [Candidatus Kryptonia bacterium]